MGHNERAHARFSFSGSYMWVNCGGSIYLRESLGELPPPGPSALKGTKQHEVNADGLASFIHFKVNGVELSDWRAKVTADEEIGFEVEEAIETAENYISFIWNKVLECALTGKAWGIEDKLCLDDHLGLWGTTDFWAVYINDKGQRTGVIVDYKNGHNFVEIKNNPQLKCYAAALLKELRQGGKDLDVVRTVIIQPNAECETYREVSYTAKQLDAWEQKLYKNAKAIVDGKAKFKVGDWCTFCPAQALCKEYSRELSVRTELALVDMDEIKLPEVEKLSDDQIKKIILHGEMVESFIKSARAYATDRHKAGRPIEGLKLINGPTRRTWRQETESIAKALVAAGIENPYQPKLITITNAEKKVGKEALRDLVTTTKPSLQLVPVEDPRPAIQSAVELLGEIPAHETNNVQRRD